MWKWLTRMSNSTISTRARQVRNRSEGSHRTKSCVSAKVGFWSAAKGAPAFGLQQCWIC